MHLPLDWPRINQFPEYFTMENGRKYSIIMDKSVKSQVITGEELMKGYPVSVNKGETLKLIVSVLN
jgi:hypothetical protein